MKVGLTTLPASHSTDSVSACRCLDDAAPICLRPITVTPCRYRADQTSMTPPAGDSSISTDRLRAEHIGAEVRERHAAQQRPLGIEAGLSNISAVLPMIGPPTTKCEKPATAHRQHSRTP
jgi:hypothetical protein